MTGGKRSYHFDVTEYFFRLTSECIRLHSNHALRHVTLSELIDDRADRTRELITQHEIPDLKEHLRLIPSDGQISLEISILESSAENIENAIPELITALEQNVSFIDLLSLIFFDLLIVANATEIFTKLNLGFDNGRAYRKLIAKEPSNIVPFKK